MKSGMSAVFYNTQQTVSFPASNGLEAVNISIQARAVWSPYSQEDADHQARQICEGEWHRQIMKHVYEEMGR